MTDATKLFSADDVRAMLRRECEKAGGQSAWARAHDVAQSYVNSVISGKQIAGLKLSTALGLAQIIAWEKRA